VGAAEARQPGADLLGMWREASKIEEVRQREVRDLPWCKYETTVMVEYYRIRCPKWAQDRASAATADEGSLQPRFRGCGGIGQRCGSRPPGGAAVRTGSRHRAGDRSEMSGALECKAGKQALRQMGVDEIYLGKKTEVPDSGQQFGNRRTALVWTGSDAGDAGRLSGLTVLHCAYDSCRRSRSRSS
jgi:hypothetical protein